MSITDRIESIAKKNGSNLKQLEQQCGLGNGTIRRWDKQSPRLDKLSKVASYLNVSLDYLVYGDSEISTEFNSLRKAEVNQDLLCDGSPLADDETDLVAMFRLMSTDQKKEVFDYTYYKYRQYVELGKESIYSTFLSEDFKRTSGPDEEEETPFGTA